MTIEWTGGNADANSSAAPAWGTRPTRRSVVKLLLTSLVAIFAMAMVLYMLQPVQAAGPIDSPAAPYPMQGLAPAAWPPGGVWPPPREPLDSTPITPFETVGGLPYEP
jgi:uncharacterized BrkB/YihY/UPF0761 family membrane protein